MNKDKVPDEHYDFNDFWYTTEHICESKLVQDIIYTIMQKISIIENMKLFKKIFYLKILMLNLIVLMANIQKEIIIIGEK